MFSDYPILPGGGGKNCATRSKGGSWTPLKLDPAFFCLRDFSGQLIGMIIVHVDDMLFGHKQQSPSRISHISPH